MDLSFRSIQFAIHYCHISHTMQFCDFVDRGSLTPVPWYTSNYPVWKRYPHQLIPNWSSVNLIRFEYFYISNECSCAHLTQGGKTFGGEFLKYADCSFFFFVTGKGNLIGNKNIFDQIRIKAFKMTHATWTNKGVWNIRHLSMNASSNAGRVSISYDNSALKPVCNDHL